MIIWLDDLRDPKNYGHPEAIWIKDGNEFLVKGVHFSMSGKLKRITEIFFDNDLGEGSPEGYYCFCKVEEQLAAGRLPNLKNIYVHSSNPSAVKKFMLAKDSLLQNYGVMLKQNIY